MLPPFDCSGRNRVEGLEQGVLAGEPGDRAWGVHVSAVPSQTRIASPVCSRIAGKVFEYIGSRRPIIGIAHEGAITELPSSTVRGRLRDDHVPAIERIILEYYGDYLYNKADFSPNVKAVAQFERKEITKRLAQLFDESLGHTAL